MAQKKILLVDDAELFLALEKTFFNRSVFEILTARSGTEALEMVRGKNPDLVFMDLYMPGMNGDECCRLIKNDQALCQIPIVIVTQAGRDDDIERCREMGADAILLKPVQRSDFLETARLFLGVKERIEPRWQLRLKITYGTPEVRLTDCTVNVSTGGMYIATLQLLPVDTILSVEFHLPERSVPLRCSARVAWINDSLVPKKPSLPSGMGVQFIDLAGEDINSLRECLRKFSA